MITTLCPMRDMSGALLLRGDDVRGDEHIHSATKVAGRGVARAGQVFVRACALCVCVCACISTLFNRKAAVLHCWRMRLHIHSADLVCKSLGRIYSLRRRGA